MKRVLTFYCLFSILITSSILNISVSVADTINLKKAPSSLKQWYKPDNKRQVWLHTMFKLRREMQAMREYAAVEDKQGVEKWLTGFDKHYNSIAKMIPEWKDKIKPQLLSDLKKHTNKNDFYHVALTLNKLDDTCESCHKDYQAQVIAIYRSPDYQTIRINDIDGTPQNIENNMQDTSMYVNQVLIALADGNNEKALVASKNLKLQLNNLGESCSVCHKTDIYPKERILGSETSANILKLQKNIREGNVKDSQKIMGDIAVTVCARCHNTHKIVSDLRKTLLPEEPVAK